VTRKALLAYEERFPEIKWREPIRVASSEDGDWGWACRVCVALFGMNGRDIRNLTQDYSAMVRHIREMHVEEMDESG
jgi:hypothetical protein